MRQRWNNKQSLFVFYSPFMLWFFSPSEFNVLNQLKSCWHGSDQRQRCAAHHKNYGDRIRSFISASCSDSPRTLSPLTAQLLRDYGCRTFKGCFPALCNSPLMDGVALLSLKHAVVLLPVCNPVTWHMRGQLLYSEGLGNSHVSTDVLIWKCVSVSSLALENDVGTQLSPDILFAVSPKHLSIPAVQTMQVNSNSKSKKVKCLLYKVTEMVKCVSPDSVSSLSNSNIYMWKIRGGLIFIGGFLTNKGPFSSAEKSQLR